MLSISSRSVRRIVLVIVDLVSLSIAIALIFGVYPSSAMRLTVRTKFIHGLILVGCVFLVRFILRIYSQSWRFANESAYLTFIAADSLGGAIYFFISNTFMVWKISAIHTLAVVAMGLIFTLSTRFVYQWLRVAERGTRHRPLRRKGQPAQEQRVRTRVAIVGASGLGVQLAQELLGDRGAKYLPVCFFDNNSQKVGSYILGLKVFPEDESVALVAQKMSVNTFVIAIPYKDAAFLQKLFLFYKQFDRSVLIYDYPANRLLEDGQPKTIREINIEDLLPRQMVSSLGEEKTENYRGATILVTGAGGSIGSELCRQLVKLQPERMVLLDIYENGVYDLCQELQAKESQVRFEIEIASVRDREKIDGIMAFYRPQFVFHAAAHKHVPLMEHNPDEAIKNNFFGTLNVVDAAEKYGVNRFLLISSDKAVNPANIMGATKRLCEMIIQSRKESQTAFVAVRFGNVLNSNGSVIPLFLRQIAQGGPVTITDKRIVRYFMMIPEAAQLVLQTGCRAEKGDIYVLNMGSPVRILDLAENLIRLSGLVPYHDIDIVEIGLRPGEKLYEELIIDEKRMQRTGDNKIYIENVPALTREDMAAIIHRLKGALEDSSEGAIKRVMHEVLPEYVESPDIANQNPVIHSLV